MIRLQIWLLLAAVFVASKAFGFFEFHSANAPDLKWDPQNDKSLKVSIPVHFRSWCEAGCVGQAYRLALSDDYPGDSQSGSYSRTEAFPADSLKKYVGNNVRWRQGGQQADMVPGNWTHQSLTTVTNSSVTGELDLTFLKSSIEAWSPGQYQFPFWIAGEDISGTLHFDSIQVNVLIVIPNTVCISALEDVDLYYRDLSGLWLWKDTQFCVFASNGGGYSVELDGRNNPGGRFQLASLAGRQMYYRLSFRDNYSSRWTPVNKAGELPDWFQGSRYLDCNGGRNATLRVEINNKQLSRVPVDTYSDVVTVTVRAY